MRPKSPLTHRLLGTPQAPEDTRWAFGPLAIFGLFAVLRAGSTLAIWAGAPPYKIEPWLQLVAGVCALLATLGMWRGRSWGRAFLIPWAATTLTFLVYGVSINLAKHGPHPDRDLVIISWGFCAAVAVALVLVVRWFWRRTLVRPTGLSSW